MQSFRNFYKNKKDIFNENNNILNDLDGVKQIIDLAWTNHKRDILNFITKLIKSDSSLNINYNFDSPPEEKEEPEIIKPTGIDSM